MDEPVSPVIKETPNVRPGAAKNAGQPRTIESALINLVLFSLHEKNSSFEVVSFICDVKHSFSI